jgi:hypothetical protein
MLTRRRFAQALSLPLTLAVALLAFTSHWGAEAKPIQGASSPLPRTGPPIHKETSQSRTRVFQFQDGASDNQGL